MKINKTIKIGDIIRIKFQPRFKLYNNNVMIRTEYPEETEEIVITSENIEKYRDENEY